MIKIDKITMAVGDMDAMRHFYASTFGIQFHPFTLAERELFTGQLGEMEFMLCPKDLAGVDANINTVQIRLVIDDVETAYHTGLNSGGSNLSGVQEIEGRLHASLRDPDGNSLEIIQAG